MNGLQALGRYRQIVEQAAELARDSMEHGSAVGAGDHGYLLEALEADRTGTLDAETCEDAILISQEYLA